MPVQRTVPEGVMLARGRRSDLTFGLFVGGLVNMNTISRHTTVIISSTPDAFLVRCARCNGSGGNTCSTCKGAGKVLLRIRDDWAGREDVGVVKCARCNVSGGNTCSTCHGVGALVRLFPRVVCARCNGSGGNTCSTCHGVGSIWVGNLRTY